MSTTVSAESEINIRLSDWIGKTIFREYKSGTKYEKILHRSGKQEGKMKGREHTDIFTVLACVQ